MSAWVGPAIQAGATLLVAQQQGKQAERLGQYQAEQERKKNIIQALQQSGQLEQNALLNIAKKIEESIGGRIA